VRCKRGEHYEQEEECGSGNNNIIDNIRDNLHISKVRMDNALIARAIFSQPNFLLRETYIL